MAIRQHIKYALFEAVNRAEGFGECQYVKDERPCCVAAQACSLVGIPVSVMKTWKDDHFEAVSLGCPWDRKKPDACVQETLTKEEQVVINDLQRIWDGGKTPDMVQPANEFEARREMINLIERQPVAQ